MIVAGIDKITSEKIKTIEEITLGLNNSILKIKWESEKYPSKFRQPVL